MWSALSLILLVSSPATGESSPTHPASSAPTSVPIRVASYNAWLLPLASADLVRRAIQIGPAIRELEPDLVCLQEAWYSPATDAIRVSLRGRLPHHVVAGGGLATISRWPILWSEFVPFDEHPELSIVERFAKKGWLLTIVGTPLGPIQVVNTHLVWEGRRASGHKQERAHWAQVTALNEALRHRDTLPTILCGDLNHRAIEGETPTGEFAQWLANGFVDTAQQTPADGRWSPRARTRVGYPRGPTTPPRGGDPDYILVRSGKTLTLSAKAFRQALDTPETALSDHNLLLTDLLLTK